MWIFTYKIEKNKNQKKEVITKFRNFHNKIKRDFAIYGKTSFLFEQKLFNLN